MPGIDIHTPTPASMPTPTPTSTPTPTPAPTPVLTLAQQGNENHPMALRGKKVDITGKNFPQSSFVSFYTKMNPTQCRAGGALTRFPSRPEKNVKADGSFDLQT